MNAAERENARNATRASIARWHEEYAKREWQMQYKFKDIPAMKWLDWQGMLHLDVEVAWTLKYLRSKYPDYSFRAVKTIHISYTRTIVRS